MKQEIKKIQKSENRHRVLKPTQTGFSSPATHYSESRIDLNNALIENPDASFFIRVIDNSFQEFGIKEKDVLIIDKSLLPSKNQLVFVIEDGEFQIKKIAEKEEKAFQIWGVITYIIKSVK